MFLNSHDGKGLEAGGQLTNVSRIREGLENIILEKCLKHWIFFLLFDGDGPPELEIKIPLDNSSCNFSRTHILQNSISDILYTFCLRGEGGGESTL